MTLQIQTVSATPITSRRSERRSERLAEIHRLICTGARYRDIAGRLGIAEITVKIYASQIMRQHGVRSRAALAACHRASLPGGVADEALYEPTGRQSEVLDLILRGCSNKEIAYQLGMAEQTVKFHVRCLLLGFRVQNRSALIAVAP